MATSATGLPVPDLGYPPNVPADMLLLGKALDNVIVPVFADAASRDAARSAGAQFWVCIIAGVPWMIKSGSWVIVAGMPDITAAIAAAPKAQLIASVAPNAQTIGAGGGTIGLVGGQPMAAATYNRIVRVFLDVVIASSTGYAGFFIVSNGTQFGNGVRGITPQTTVHVEIVTPVAAGTGITWSANMQASAAMSTYGANIGSFGVVAWPA